MRTIVALALLGLTASAQSPGSLAPSAEATLRGVVEAFRTSLIAKDRTRFLALFHGESIPWIGVLDEASLPRVRARRPSAPKATPLGQQGPAAFIDDLIATPAPCEETFTDLRIDADGSVASLSFNYTFLEGGVPINSGRESWHLVATEQGWKITSVIYSIHLPPKG